MDIHFLNTPIEYLKSVGPQRAEVLKKELGIFTFGDLLSFYPFRYVDRSKFYKISEINSDAAYIQLKGQITGFREVGEARVKRLIAHFKDESGTIDLIFFQGIKWVKDKLNLNTDYIVFGKPTEFKGKYNLVHPDVDLASEVSPANMGALQAMYNSGEKLKTRGLDTKGIAKLQQLVVNQLKGNVVETLTPKIIDTLKLIPREQAILNIHFPQNADALLKAQFRLKFEELFYIQLKLLKQKTFRHKYQRGHVFSVIGDYFNKFYHEKLPFELTNAQKRVLKEIRKDMGTGKQMNRLLQGDVGSGKTVVALMCMLMALDNSTQACMMAPTELLANQHFESIKRMVDGMEINIALLTGSTRAKERRLILERLLSGELHIIIGTHALIEDDVQFKNIGLSIIDEQHRFGVAQRFKLWQKNSIPPHVLVMTATPIPRTLAMTVYGDLDVSVIDELPAGRKPIKTLHKFDANRLAVWGFIKEQIKLGRQIYIVYPLIKESEKMDYKDLMDGYANVLRDFPEPEYMVSIVHGQMKPQEKDWEMQRFIKKQTQIMVATTVIEVGVDVPNASVMIVESAERFGLSQLHQLRGRVGRGAEQSYCILMTGYKLGADAKLRMETMVRTNDGFEISEVDLKLRGPGDMEGTQQSGILDLKIADIAKDQQILQTARHCAQDILDIDNELTLPENGLLLRTLQNMDKNRPNWSKVS